MLLTFLGMCSFGRPLLKRNVNNPHLMIEWTVCGRGAVNFTFGMAALMLEATYRFSQHMPPCRRCLFFFRNRKKKIKRGHFARKLPDVAQNFALDTGAMNKNGLG